MVEILSVNIKAELIQKYMRENQLTKKEFCEVCGICEGTLKRLLDGGFDCRLASVLKVRKVLEVTLNELLNVVFIK